MLKGMALRVGDTMPITTSIMLVILGLVIGGMLAILLGFHSSLQEIAMLCGVGGWPGRIAASQLIAWFAIAFVLGPPSGGWLFYGTVSTLLIGTLAAPFYLNNRSLIQTVARQDDASTPADLRARADGLVAVSGEVIVNDATQRDELPLTPDPVTAPFTATPCAAFEWAIKRRQRLSRRNTYVTMDSGESAGDFVLDSGEGYVGVRPDSPTILMFSGVGVTGYETVTTNPASSDEIERSGGLFNGRMRYCETTLDDGGVATVIAPVQAVSVRDEYAEVGGDAEGVSFIVDSGFERVKRVVDRYLRWTPHVAAISLAVSWAYLVALGVT